MEPSQLNERSQNRRSGRTVKKDLPPQILVRTSHQDPEGRWWVVLVPVGHEGDAHMGIPVGPPDLTSLGLPEAVEVRLHNQLFQRGLLTARDLKGRGKEVFAAIQAAYRVDMASVTALYQ